MHHLSNKPGCKKTFRPPFCFFCNTKFLSLALDTTRLFNFLTNKFSTSFCSSSLSQFCKPLAARATWNNFNATKWTDCNVTKEMVPSLGISWQNVAVQVQINNLIMWSVLRSNDGITSPQSVQWHPCLQWILQQHRNKAKSVDQFRSCKRIMQTETIQIMLGLCWLFITLVTTLNQVLIDDVANPWFRNFYREINI